MYLDIFLHKIKKIIPKKLFKALQPAYHFILSWLAAVFYKFPSEEMIIIGITGTTGKTTGVYLIAKMLAEAGFKTGFTSTAMFNDGNSEWLNDKKMTMIGRLFMQKILRKMVTNGCQYAIVETSSEGITQFRHKFINYDVLIFTGLYPEHIEAHGSFENYKKSKGKLFAHLKKCQVKYIDEKRQVVKSATGLKKIELHRVKKNIIVNGDDEYAGYFLNFWADNKIVFTRNKNVEFNKEFEIVNYGDIIATGAGTSFVFNNIKVDLKLLGDFNATNAMAAVCAGLSQEINPQKIKRGLEKIEGIAGRLEKIDEGQNFTVIVDYAFEPKAVGKLYEFIKYLNHKKVIHVFGSCGGGRDIARRPVLGKIVGANADVAIITNEDPYDDDPSIIIEQVAVGAEQAGMKLNDDLFKILDRREAIKKAIYLADEGDIVLITGKGSEQAICVANGNKIPWDDRTIVRGILADLNKSEPE
jgi:UDP-N-acetylmuramoyl-L-alanyl-D-glutamate--2,6-diaminopimelate ligase